MSRFPSQVGPVAPTAVVAALAALTACAGAPTADREGGMRERAAAAPATDEDRYGPLDVGADYRRYRKLTDRPFQSLDHGSRWVDVYVNAIGADAYLSGAPIPVGTIVVKTSWQ